MAQFVLRVVKPLYLAVLRRLPDKQKRALMYFRVYRRRPHLGNPRTFGEKLNWRVVNDRRPVIAILGDKVAMKEHARASGVDVLVPEVCWAGTDLAELAEVDLPEHWVLKPNHGSTQVHFGSGRPDVGALRRVTDGWLDDRLYEEDCQWAYSQARRMLIVERFLGAPGHPPADFKFYVFAGVVHLVQVDVGRFSHDHRRHYYSPDWSLLTVGAGPAVPRPARLSDMLAVAAQLGAELDFIRVDLYEVEGEIWFGELTPYPGGGLDPDEPEGWDRKLGDLWVLPSLDEVRAPA